MPSARTFRTEKQRRPEKKKKASRPQETSQAFRDSCVLAKKAGQQKTISKRINATGRRGQSRSFQRCPEKGPSASRGSGVPSGAMCEKKIGYHDGGGGGTTGTFGREEESR